MNMALIFLAGLATGGLAVLGYVLYRVFKDFNIVR